jgi:hypothetical protein
MGGRKRVSPWYWRMRVATNNIFKAHQNWPYSVFRKLQVNKPNLYQSVQHLYVFLDRIQIISPNIVRKSDGHWLAFHLSVQNDVDESTRTAVAPYEQGQCSLRWVQRCAQGCAYSAWFLPEVSHVQSCSSKKPPKHPKLGQRAYSVPRKHSTQNPYVACANVDMAVGFVKRLPKRHTRSRRFRGSPNWSSLTSNAT